MTMEYFPTGNSHTRVGYSSDWRVLDIGSGHHPHPRANVLVDRFLNDDRERSGQTIVLPPDKAFVIADACALPFKDRAFDFVICSHVAEHIENVESFCSELNRIASRGYLETPSKLAEKLRPQPFHKWFFSLRNNMLVFEKKSSQQNPRWYQILFFSFYFYNVPAQLAGKNVLAFSYGCRKPWHYLLVAVRRTLVRLWLVLRRFTYTRMLWEGSFEWTVHQ